MFSPYQRVKHHTALVSIRFRTVRDLIWASYDKGLTVKCCLVSMKNQGMTAIVSRIHHNEQTPGQFVEGGWRLDEGSASVPEHVHPR